MQCFLTRHKFILFFFLYLKARVYTENTSDAWHIPWYPTQKHCITSILYNIAKVLPILSASSTTFSLSFSIDFERSIT